MIYYIDWRIGLIVTALFIVIVALTRYVSLGTLVGAVSLVVLMPLFNKDRMTVVFSLLFVLLVIFRHRANIKRLAAGNEARLGERHSKGD